MSKLMPEIKVLHCRQIGGLLVLRPAIRRFVDSMNLGTGMKCWLQILGARRMPGEATLTTAKFRPFLRHNILMPA